ncbi:HD domain-containing protein [Streptomyces litmocidini]|uniref:HD domain-containing protein n=1 Tax=Streptomyces litmocidini TaxID=67318 RepID=UPI00167D3D6D|nr:HD domain-containing protein [Streptomyces litmocidini]
MTTEEEHARDLDLDPDLLQRWNATLLAARAGREGPDPAPYGRNLLSRWAEPQRRYHTVTHLRAVLDRIDELADQGGEGGELELVRLAAWFHDAVYRPDRSENEERSAALAEKALTEAGLTPREVTEVARLVRLTTTHDPAPGDLNGETLCDADLAVLATGPDAYRGYAAAVREEYSFVPADAFREGRATVLRRLLSLPRLFRTPYGAAAWEGRARENLERELAELAGTSGKE